MILAYLATFIFIICLTSGIYLFGYAARRSGSFYVITLEVVAGIIIITPLVLLSDHISFKELFTLPARENWLWLGAAAITGFIGGNFFSVINLKVAGEKINSLLSPAITACAVIAAAFVFKEVVSATKVAGFIITVVAVAIFLAKAPAGMAGVTRLNAALWSGAANILCITATIIFSILGTMHSGISILHSIWLRLFIALPFMLPSLLATKKIITGKPLPFYVAIAAGVVLQTIIASSLWFYCTYKIGASTFQVLVATLPFFVYTADVFLFKRTKPAPYFLITALLAIAGVIVIMM